MCMKAAWSEKGRERKGIYTDHKLKYDKGKCQTGQDILILVLNFTFTFVNNTDFSVPFFFPTERVDI